MTLIEYIKSLQKFVEDNPKLGKCEVWTAGDDEGNDFQKIVFSPSTRYVNKLENYKVWSDSIYLNKEELKDDDLKVKDFKEIIIVN